jgi:hypothetical protein
VCDVSRGGEAEDFIERSLDQASKEGKKRADPTALLTTRREALSLYRDVWRASFLFVWKNDKGEDWCVRRSPPLPSDVCTYIIGPSSGTHMKLCAGLVGGM